MARVVEAEFTVLNDREIAGSGIGTSPKGVRGYSDLQQAVYDLQPQDTADVQAGVDTAQAAAIDAQATGEIAQGTADSAMMRADDAYELAGTKVTKNFGPAWTAPAGAQARTALPAYPTSAASALYDAAEVTALKAQVAALTAALAAVIADGRANGALTS